MAERSGSPRRGWIRIVGTIAGLALLFLFRTPLVAAMHRVDQRWLGEAIIDTLSRLRGDEDWTRVEPLARPPDYRWLQVTPEPIRIAHALGEAGQPGANTISALQRSLARGIRHFEVDLWLEDDRIRCHHGPPGPPPFKSGDCEMGELLKVLPRDAWLVLDIKTDFAATGTRVLDLAGDRAGQLIFQLYEPEHLHQFNAWQAQHPALPGPLVTAYLAHRAVDHVAANVRRAGVGVLTLPMERLPAYGHREPGLALFAHPVHDCETLATALRGQAAGVYQLSSLNCPR